MEDAFKAALDGIDALNAAADAVLDWEIAGIADAAGQDDGRAIGLRLKRWSTLEDLIGGAAWLTSSRKRISARTPR